MSTNQDPTKVLEHFLEEAGGTVVDATPSEPTTEQPQVRKQMASAYCGSCLDEMKSERPGHYVACGCGRSFIDTDRWDANRHRYGGDAKPDNKGNFWVYGGGHKRAHMESQKNQLSGGKD